MAQKNILQYIILGLLKQHPKTGYELKQSFENDIGEFWQAKHSQIYPELKKLEQKKLIHHEIEIVGTKMETKKYYITTAGKDYFLKWQFLESTDINPHKDEFTLKLYFIEDKSDPHIKTMVENQLKLHIDKLNHLNERETILFSDKEDINNAYGHYLILKKAISREKDYIDWLGEI
ncbi:PadR family transcriptional regulator [Companilactobacillus sp. DQM5]|uniref:PadR family transcriptional regulator n=1 Tax=Companilactobacillus sp. DQM5 TaxID=3463359 RepID=UPI00405866E0